MQNRLPYATEECPIVGQPCRVPDRSTGRVVGWRTLEEKANWLDGAASLDALRGGTLRVAERFCRIPTAEARTRALQRWVRDNIRYVYDWRVSQGTRGEEFADAQTCIERGYGDCDDKSRLFVALVRAAERVRPLGAQASIRPVFRAHPLWEFVHVQAESRWPGSYMNPNAMAGGWLLSELILADCEIGQNPDELPREANGERKIAGGPSIPPPKGYGL
jgi:transglutaminase superfamily protein